MTLAMVPDEASRWYVARTQPRKEAFGLANLRRQGFESFLPCIARTVRHARRTRTVRAPLFPGYVFVRFDPDQVQWRCINGTFGLIGLIMAGDRPQPVPRGIVETLQRSVDNTGLVDAGSDLRPGQGVRILSGPFADLVGELQSLDDSGRARVLLEIMGGQRCIELSRRQLAGAA